MPPRMPSAEEQNRDNADYWARLRPAVNLSTVSEVTWEAAAKRGDHATAFSAGITAAAAYAAKQSAHEVWVAVREIWAATAWATEDVDRPLAEVMQQPPEPIEVRADADDSETIEQALDRFVSEVNEHRAEAVETVDELAPLLRPLGQKSVSERLARIRGCSEWSNLRGVLPPSACVALCRSLLVRTPVYFDVKKKLSDISRLRNDARDLKRELVVLGFTPGLSERQHEALVALLDKFASWSGPDSGTGKPVRHQNDSAPRVFTVRLIAAALLPYMGEPRMTAIANVKARATGIAALAGAALSEHVTPKDVRGALKDWTGD